MKVSRSLVGLLLVLAGAGILFGGLPQSSAVAQQLCGPAGVPCPPSGGGGSKHKPTPTAVPPTATLTQTPTSTAAPTPTVTATAIPTATATSAAAGPAAFSKPLSAAAPASPACFLFMCDGSRSWWIGGTAFFLIALLAIFLVWRRPLRLGSSASSPVPGGHENLTVTFRDLAESGNLTFTRQDIAEHGATSLPAVQDISASKDANLPAVQHLGGQENLTFTRQDNTGLDGADLKNTGGGSA